MEVEALEAIYMDEFAKLSDTPLAWKVHVVPNPGGEDNAVGVDFICEIPPEYPEVVPSINIAVTKGLTPKQRELLLDLAEEKARENVGMVMGYSVAEAVREWLCDNNVDCGDSGSMHAAMLRRMAESDRAKRRGEEHEAAAAAAAAAATAETPEELQKRLQAYGTPVTPETFAAWKAAFDREMVTATVVAKPMPGAAAAAALPPTGKELFQRYLVSYDTDDDEIEEDDEEEAAAAGGGGGGGGRGGVVAVDERLFMGGDDDLSELDSDEDEDDDGGGV
ncbi:unnamed protein product [Phaeothamnion confervicola]